MALATKQVEVCENREALTARVQQLVSEGYKVRDFSEDSVFLTFHSLGKPVPHVLWALFTVLIGNVFYALLSYASTRREIWVRVGEA